MLPYYNFIAIDLLFVSIAYCQSLTLSDVAGIGSFGKPRSICDIVRCPLDLHCEAISAICKEPPCPRYRCVKHLTCLPKPVPVGCRVIAYKKDEAGCPDHDLDCDIHQDREILRKCRRPVDSGRWCGRTARRWYHDRSTHTCHEFTYGGCDGNDNNFATQAECTQVCGLVFPCTPVRAYKALPPGCHWKIVIGPQFCPIPKIVC